MRIKMGVHAVMVPYPGQGHINPMMQFAKKLASRGITITFVLTNSWHKITTEANGEGEPDAFEHAQTLGLDIRLACIPDCLPTEFERASNFAHFINSLANMEEPVQQLITSLRHQNICISCLVADTFLAWAVPLANRLDLCSLSFFPMSLSVFSIVYHSELVETEDGSITRIPGLTPLSAGDVPLDFFKTKKGDTSPVPEMAALSFQNVQGADWVAVNSFMGLEGNVAEALWHKIRVYCVGPLLPSAYLHSSSSDRVVGTSSRPQVDCKQWLHSKPTKSVVYVSFGSLYKYRAPSQLREMAVGLKESGYYFVWVLREEEKVWDVLADGFLQGKGMVIPWCSQLEVLSHPAVGGFVSHCGWNSCIESIVCGVPILGFPLGIDQFTNCKLIVDEWKVGLRLRGREQEEEVVPREEIKEKVKRLMEGEEMRREAERFRDFALSEVSPGGFSDSNLEAIVNGLKAKSHLNPVL